VLLFHLDNLKRKKELYKKKVLFFAFLFFLRLTGALHWYQGKSRLSSILCGCDQWFNSESASSE